MAWVEPGNSGALELGCPRCLERRSISHRNWAADGEYLQQHPKHEPLVGGDTCRADHAYNAGEVYCRKLAQSLKAIIPWVPSVLLAKLFRASFSANVALEMLPALGVVIGCAGLVLAAVVWRIRLMDR